MREPFAQPGHYGRKSPAPHFRLRRPIGISDNGSLTSAKFRRFGCWAVLLLFFCLHPSGKSWGLNPNSQPFSNSPFHSNSFPAENLKQDQDQSQPSPGLQGELNSTIRLRISWGGGRPRLWRGKIVGLASDFRDQALLGISSDVAGSVTYDRQRILIDDWSETTFGGVDVTVNFGPDATLELEFGSQGEVTPEIRELVSLEELIDSRYIRELDATGNRLVIARLPSDRVPLEIDRGHLIFRSGEEFSFGYRVNYAGQPGGRLNGRLKIREATAAGSTPSGGISARLPSIRGAGLSQRNQTIELGMIELDSNGSSAIQPVKIQVPQEEGVYQLTLELGGIWQQVATRPALQRTLEIVVLADASSFDPPTSDSPDQGTNWKSLMKRDLASSDPQWLAHWREVARRTGLAAEDWVRWKGGAEPVKRIVGEKEMLELPAGSWQVIPLATEHLDRPHYVDVEYLSGQPVSLGISLLEIDAEGQIAPYGVDSGLHIPNFLVDPGGDASGFKTKKHRIYFWPQQRECFLLLANRDRRHPAVLGEVEFGYGPRRLVPAGDLRAAHQRKTGNEGGSREYLAFYESPMFFRNFGAQPVLDDLTGQSLDSWLTFYQGTDRLIQHLKAHGYTGAMINVASEGSALYPSPHLSNSPKLDSGIFFSNGQDPLRKDVVELLYRMFEREGLTLVPLLTLSSPLPAIEIRRSLASDLDSDIGLTQANGLIAARRLRHHLPIYNPLSLPVQELVVAEIEAFCHRYGRHDSFGGLGLLCRPDSYSQLPGSQWGYDSRSIKEFLVNLSVDGLTLESWAEIQLLLTEVHRDAWLQYRASAISAWYQQMLKSVQAIAPTGRLFIAPVDLYRNEEMQMALVPSLHNSSDYRRQMLKLGWTPESFAATPGLELLKPRRIAPNYSLASNRVELGLENQRQVDDFFLQARSIGDLFSHRNAWAHFAELQQHSPFDQHRGTLMRLQPLVPAGEWSVVRFLNSFRSADPNCLVDGVWMLPAGQELESQDFINQYRQLPSGPFEDVSLQANDLRIAQPPLLVRQLQQGQRTWFYLVNPTPWPIDASLSLNRELLDAPGEREIIIDSLSHKLPRPQFDHAAQRIQAQLPAFSFLVCRSNQPIVLSDFSCQLPENGGDRLRKQVHLLQTKLTAAVAAEPINLLNNSSFELEGGSPQGVDGWTLGLNDRATFRRVNADAAEGEQFLEIQNHSEDPVWIRSHPIRVPSTGRLTVSVWLRTSQPQWQPALRIAIDGTYADTQYYRYGSVGALPANSKASQLSENWQRFVVHFDDLPVEGMGDLRVGLDLMGAGEVQVDRVELYDRWFDDRDAKAISQRLASCGPLLSNPLTFESGRQLLSSYWLRFLDEHFSSAELTAQVTDQKDPTEEQPPATRTIPVSDSLELQLELLDESESRSLFRRFRRSSLRR
jgi:hypothetical protein